MLQRESGKYLTELHQELIKPEKLVKEYSSTYTVEDRIHTSWLDSKT